MNQCNNQQANSLSLENQQGFTLIELMVSITLGLIVIAIGAQIYLTSAKTTNIQQSASEIQASSIFGIQQMENHIRLANLGNKTKQMKATTPKGGIVLTQDNVIKEGDTTSAEAITLINQILTSPKTASDPARLTIQYKNVSDKDIYDCEGVLVAGGSQEYVIESYYFSNNQILCNAGRWTRSATGKTTITDIDSGGGIPIIKDVEFFDLLLGVQNKERNTAFTDIDTYKTLPDTTAHPQPFITSIKMGFLLRGSKPLPTTDEIRKTFTIFDEEITLDDSAGKYIRNVYESTTLLRNARGY